MAGTSQDKMKAVGRNLARAQNQKSSPMPAMNENKGASDGGVIGRGKKSNHTSIKGGK